jgi:hypothetical protein
MVMVMDQYQVNLSVDHIHQDHQIVLLPNQNHNHLHEVIHLQRINPHINKVGDQVEHTHDQR